MSKHRRPLNRCACGRVISDQSTACVHCSNRKRAVRPLCIECGKRTAYGVSKLCRPCYEQWKRDITIAYREPGELPPAVPA